MELIACVFCSSVEDTNFGITLHNTNFMGRVISDNKKFPRLSPEFNVFITFRRELNEPPRQEVFIEMESFRSKKAEIIGHSITDFERGSYPVGPNFAPFSNVVFRKYTVTFPLPDIYRFFLRFGERREFVFDSFVE